MSLVDLAPLGDRAFLASFGSEASAAAWAAAARARRWSGVVDVVLAYHRAAVFADPDRIDLDELERRLRGLDVSDVDAPPAASWTIPVLYDGADLSETAGRLGLLASEVIALHSGGEYVVRAIGFLPGFPYAGDLPRALSGLPRRDVPRPRVPAGSVAIAGRQTAIYPVESPGGWNLLGRTPLRIAEMEADWFPIRAGDHVRFEPMDTREFEARRDERLEREALDRPASAAARPRRVLDLSADLGEGQPNDRALLELVSSASVGCGAHAGGPEAVRETLRAAVARGVAIGAHPGWPDPEHFGRREHAMAAEPVCKLILDQCAFLDRLAAEIGAVVRFLKPHGALYNQAQRDPEIARGVIAAAIARGLPLLGMPGTLLERLAAERGAPFIGEGFPDRRYRDDGTLAPRSEPNAVLELPEEIEFGLARLIADPRIATLCIHGDRTHAVASARLVRRSLEARGVTVRSFVEARA